MRRIYRGEGEGRVAMGLHAWRGGDSEEVTRGVVLVDGDEAWAYPSSIISLRHLVEHLGGMSRSLWCGWLTLRATWTVI